MSFFKQVEGEAAVLVEGGIYKQVDVYTRDGFLYAKVSGGFVRMMADGSTTKAKMRLEFMSFDGALCRDKLGRLCTADVEGSTLLEPAKKQLLLGAS